MKEKFRAVTALIKKFRNLIVFTGVIGFITVCSLMVACYLIINPYEKYVISADTDQHVRAGLVLGAGISKDGKPYDELKARLDSAADALGKGTVDKLILSGDNRFQNYNEPEAMRQYLIDKGIESDKLQPDFAGRSTYESCERTAKVFKQDKVIIFSAGSHLPRAIYLCKHFGIDARGIPSGVEANNSTRRELLARVKAVYNSNIIGEPTVLGDPIAL